MKHYFAAVTGIDENLGRILSCLKQAGLEGNTIVVFTSDHGEMMGSHNLMYKNQIYEESFGVPFIIRWPGRIAAGSREDLLLGTPDLMPSLLGLMGLAAQIPDAVEGADYSDLLLGRSAERPDSALYMKIEPQGPAVGRRGIKTPRYTFLLERYEQERVSLFDNEKDPYQLKNIAAENRSLVGKLTGNLSRWLARTRDPWSKV